MPQDTPEVASFHRQPVPASNPKGTEDSMRSSKKIKPTPRGVSKFEEASTAENPVVN